MVSMPLRAFLLFGLIGAGGRDVQQHQGFNALAGIFAFWTHSIEEARAGGCNSFNALAGIFAFWTVQTPSLTLRAPDRFNALAGIFAFWTIMR